MSSKKVIVFGATGAIGTGIIEILSKENPSWTIQAVSRSPPEESSKSRLAQKELPNVTMVQGDPTSKKQVLDLCASCDIVYCCIGFKKYEAKFWMQTWPVVVDNLLQAVKDSGDDKTKLVFCDNIYALGPGENIGLQTIPNPPLKPSSKPGIRAAMRETFQKHFEDHPGTLTVVGAADFFGPHVTATSFLGDTLAGKIIVEEASPLAIGSCNCVHDFCYAPDFAKALVVASLSNKAYDHFWIAPHSIHGKTLQDIGNMIATKAGRPSPVKFSVMGKWMVYMLSPFLGFAKEMIEMLPFWTMDYTVDDSEFTKTFGVEATPMDEALDALVDFYKAEKAKTDAK